MDAEKIIAALKYCASARSCTAKCPLWNDFLDKWTINQCRNELMRNTAIAMECMQIENNKLREGLSKQLKGQEKQLQDQKWNPGDERPSEEKPYLVLILPSDVYGVPVSEKTCYEVVRWSVKYGWCMKHNGIVLYWQELPKEPPEEDD